MCLSAMRLGFAAGRSRHEPPLSPCDGCSRVALRHSLCRGRLAGAGAASAVERQRECADRAVSDRPGCDAESRRSEEHTSELQSLMRISYAVFCLKKTKKKKNTTYKN